MTNRAIQVRFFTTIPLKIEHKLTPDWFGVLGHVKIMEPNSARGVGQMVKWETFNRDVLMGSYLLQKQSIHKGW